MEKKLLTKGTASVVKSLPLDGFSRWGTFFETDRAKPQTIGKPYLRGFTGC
jgi:hypothetical protein